MSRIGKQIITIPEKTEVKISDSSVIVKGPLGELHRSIRSEVTVSVEDGKVILKPRRHDLQTNALWGTYASHILNMIAGVNKPYEKRLVVEGIGYKADIKGTSIVMSVGFSHTIEVPIPKGIKIVSEKGVLVISGIDKELVGQFASQLRSLKKPEPYKGKGVRYENEVIRRKQGKKTA